MSSKIVEVKIKIPKYVMRYMILLDRDWQYVEEVAYEEPKCYIYPFYTDLTKIPDISNIDKSNKIYSYILEPRFVGNKNFKDCITHNALTLLKGESVCLQNDFQLIAEGKYKINICN